MPQAVISQTLPGDWKRAAPIELLRTPPRRPFLSCRDRTTPLPPPDPDEQSCCYSGRKKCHTIKNGRLIDAQLRILFLRDTFEGRVHDKWIADTPPYPLPASSELLHDLGFLAFTRERVNCRTPYKKSRGGTLTAEQKADNQVHVRRRVRIEHVNSSVKRCRIVKDVMRLVKDDVRDMVAEIAGALHNFRLRLSPWIPML